MKNLAILLLSAIIIYLIFSFIAFNPLWIIEDGYNFMRFIYLLATGMLYILSEPRKLP